MINNIPKVDAMRLTMRQQGNRQQLHALHRQQHNEEMGNCTVYLHMYVITLSEVLFPLPK